MYWHWYTAFILLFSTPRIARSTCYDPKGNALPSDWQACNSSVNRNACCRLGPLVGGDICTTSGLCLRQDGVANGFWYQDGCTAKDWTGCTKMCPDSLKAPWELVPCSDAVPHGGTWCCRTTGTTDDCCSDSTAVITTDIGKLILSTLTISSTSTGITSGTSTVTVTTTATASASGESDSSTCSNNSTVAVGTGIGVSLGAVLVASIGMLLWREKTRPKLQASSSDGGSYQIGGWAGQNRNMGPPAEMDTTAQVYEVDGHTRSS